MLSSTRATGTARVSLSNGEAQADNLSFDPSISANGRLVAFSSSASNLVAGDTNDEGDAFVRDRAAATTVRISVSSAGAQANGQSFDSSISADGGRIAFSSSATNLDGGGAFTDVFIRDTREDSTNLVSESPGGAPGNGHSFPPSISADGCFLAFPSPATNLVAGDAPLAARCPTIPPGPGFRPWPTLLDAYKFGAEGYGDRELVLSFQIPGRKPRIGL